MTIKTLPALPNVLNRAGMGFEVTPTALARWNSSISAASADGENVISILDPIGADFFGEGVTAKRISAALRSIGNQDVIVNMNSPGGDFLEGVTIYNLFQQHPKKVTMRILGMAASAASIIAAAGDVVQIAKAGFVMIHNAQAVVIGDRNDMLEFAGVLETFDKAMAGVYATRTGLDEKVIGKMMDKETVMSSQNAIDKGFADELLPSDVVAEKARAEGDLNPQFAIRRIDALMARAGATRVERRELINAFKAGTQDAADGATRDAGVNGDLLKALSKIDIPIIN